MLAEKLEYIEPVDVPEFYVSGLARVEDLGDGNVRFVCYKKEHDFNVIALKIIQNRSSALFHMRVALVELGVRCCGALRAAAGAVLSH